MELEHKSLTENIIGAAIQVHRQLGPGFTIYENARVIELRNRGLTLSQQTSVVITYDGVEVGKYRLDLLVEDTIIVELKAVKNLQSVHFAVVKSYLRAFLP